MQLKLDREEGKRGLIFKKTEYRVKTQLICNEEEKAAIQKLSLDERVFVDSYEHDGIDWGGRQVGAWVDGEVSFPCEDIPAAQSIEAEIHECAKIVSEQVKHFLEAGGEAEASRVIDL